MNPPLSLRLVGVDLCKDLMLTESALLDQDLKSNLLIFIYLSHLSSVYCIAQGINRLYDFSLLSGNKPLCLREVFFYKLRLFTQR